MADFWTCFGCGEVFNTRDGFLGHECNNLAAPKQDDIRVRKPVA